MKNGRKTMKTKYEKRKLKKESYKYETEEKLRKKTKNENKRQNLKKKTYYENLL